MSLEEKIKKLNELEGLFVSSLLLQYNKNKHSLSVSYSSVLGLYDIYDIHEGVNQREESNHVKYRYKRKILTILVDQNYTWDSARTTSTDILRLPCEIEDVKVEFFEYSGRHK